MDSDTLIRQFMLKSALFALSKTKNFYGRLKARSSHSLVELNRQFKQFRIIPGFVLENFSACVTIFQWEGQGLQNNNSSNLYYLVKMYRIAI